MSQNEEATAKQQKEITTDFTEGDAFDLPWTPIDAPFVKRYWRPDFPHMKCGDMIFVAMAKADNPVLITEDNDMRNKAADFGVRAYRIKEYLNEFAKP